MTQQRASNICTLSWRVVVIVAMILGMFPGRVGAKSQPGSMKNLIAPVVEWVASSQLEGGSLASALATDTDASSHRGPSLVPQHNDLFSPALSLTEDLQAEGENHQWADGPEVELAPEPTVMLAPGVLSLTPDAYLLTAGQTVAVGVRVDEGPSGNTAGATLKLDLPPGMHLVKGPRTWTLPDVRETAFDETIILRAERAAPGDVFKISAILGQEGYVDQTADLLLGTATGDELTVLMDPVVARDGTDIAVTVLPLGSPGESAATTDKQITEDQIVEEPASLVDAPNTLYMPMLGGGTEIQQENVNGFVRRWRIDASERGKLVQLLPASATVVISTLRLEEAGVDVSQLRLWTREGETDKWRAVPAHYLPDQQLIVARTRHFSQWGLGDNLSVSGELLPSVKSFAEDGFTGFAQLHYPIETPDGLGGMNPGLSLNYSSGIPDDIENLNGTYDYEVQAGWAGHGWIMGGTSYIARNFANDQYHEYQLVLAGMGAEIRWNGSKWVTDPEQFVKIERIPAPGGYGREDMDRWVVTAKDGTRYHFGSYQYDGYSEPIGNWTEVIFDEVYHSTQWEGVRTGSKWYLRVVVDPLGNRMEYDYDHETDAVGACFQSKGWTGSDWSYDKATYLREVRWSGNNTAGVSTKMKVVLARESRPDWQVNGWNQDCVQARYASQRLKNVTTYVYDATNNSWPILNQYKLNYSQSNLHSLLSSVYHYGKNGTTLLNRYTFGYRGGWNTVRLNSANNGQGGSVTYVYGWEQIHDCYHCEQIHWRSSLPQRRPVIQVEADDGNGGEARTNYQYSGVKGHVVNDSFEYLGHSWSQAKSYTTDNGLNVSDRLEKKVSDWYHQRTNSSTIDPRRGRSYQQYVYAPSNAIMQKSFNTWTNSAQNGTNWVHQDIEHIYTYDWDGNNNPRENWTYYFYENSYGNQTYVEQRASNGTSVLRRTETIYSANTNLYIVDRPSRTRRYDESGNCVNEVRYTYDSLMRLTRTDAPITSCGTTSSHNLIQTNRTYDTVGNVVREWTTGTDQDIRTVYDPDFKLFAVRRYNASNSSLDERGKYYGVRGASGVGNGLAVSDSKAYWGQMQEFCGIDTVCTQQAYDEFGRPTARWERGVGYPTVGNAQTRWSYYRKGENGGNANIVLEWSLPRCYGNFSRKLFNGFGQLIQVQTPQQDWSENVDGCNPGTTGGEVAVDYAYDALGRQTRSSVPRSVGHFSWGSGAPWTENWNSGYSETSYDALGRVLQNREPNGRTTRTYYSAWDTWSEVVGVGESNRRVSWNRQDVLGRTTLLRSYSWTGEWTVDAEIQLRYDTADQLTKTERRNGTSGNWTELSSLTYDLAGRKLTMDDADLGNWTYAYDKLGQLIRETDARNKSTCLSYNALGQTTAKTVYHSSACSGSVAAKYTYAYDGLGRPTSVSESYISGVSWKKSLSYDSLGRPSNETVTIDGQSQTMTTIYDVYQRPYATQYPDGEVVKINFNSMGLPKLMCSSYLHSSGSYWCNSNPWLVSDANYDAAGRLTKLKFPAGNGLWRTQTYHAWTKAKSGGLIDEIKVGTTDGGSDRFYRAYTYNSFGDVLNDGTGISNFVYDSLGRLTSAYGKSYAYWPTNRFKSFEGNIYGYNSFPYHGVNSINSVDRYDYDANGNMTKRNKGLSSQQTLTWSAENRLSNVSGGGVVEAYWYDADGNRIKKTSNGVTTYTWFPQYEKEGGTSIKHYSFNGMRIAVKRGSTLSYIHGDHLGSSSKTTNSNGNEVGSRSYAAYGTTRSNSGDLQTDRTFTGQKSDSTTGLMYYNARYYDPTLGTFISPDTIVPDAGMVIDYNRFAYVRNNPLRYVDPSGHCIFGLDTLVCVAVVVAGAALFLQGDDPNHQPTQEEINSQRLGGVLLFGGAAALGVGELVSAVGTAACADGECTNEVATVQRSVQTINSRITSLSGHGTYEGDPPFQTPTRVIIYSKHGARISDELGNVIESGAIYSPFYSNTYSKVYEAGSWMTDYVLHPPGGLRIVGKPITVQVPTKMSELITAEMGTVHWAACTYCSNGAWSGWIYDINRIFKPR